MNNFSQSKAHVGISACLLGQQVRFDGGHKRSPFCANVLAKYVDFVPVCPEMAIGLGTPRPTIRLIKQEQNVIARTAKGEDVTKALVDFGRRTAEQLDFISGYIFCAKSPSCGMERVRIYEENGRGGFKNGVGLYADALMKARPYLPVEEEGRLNDPILRENFVARVYAYHSWQTLARKGLTAADLIDFHARYKYLLLAHCPDSYRQLGRLLGNLSEDLQTIADAYLPIFMTALSKPASRKNHSNVLQHLQGFFKKRLPSEQRQALGQVIEDYRLGTLPLLAPITLIRHLLTQYPAPYIEKQYYLRPYPDSLSLRYGI